MRKAKGLLGIVVGLMLLFHAGGNVAFADDKGNNGTVKIHEGATEREPVQANDPHVCTFHIHGLKFDQSSIGYWVISKQAPSGSGEVQRAGWSADANGAWRTGVLTLPAGHYKLTAKQTAPATAGGEKQKVFWVECGQTSGGGNGGNTGNVGGGNSGSTTGGGNGGTGNTGNGGEQGSMPTNGSQGSKTGTGSRSKGTKGTKSGTGSASKNGGSASATNNGSGTASQSDHGETAGGGAGNAGNTGGTGAAGGAGNTGNTGSTGSAGNTGTGTTGGTIPVETGGGVAGMGTGGETSAGGIGQVTTPQTLGLGVAPGVSALPSTSTSYDSGPLAAFGAALIALGALILRRPTRQSR